jgi:indole-3-glycerol phosphate synthase
LDQTASGDRLAVIAEIKRRSPSKGPLNIELDAAALAHAYETGGAACLSVLTDHEFFGGSPADLASARDASGLPVLRKDFTVSAHDVCDARLMGADCVLLIAAALSTDELAALHRCAAELDLDALVEVHDERELDHAVDVGARLVGVNQRDLVTFEVDRERAVKLAARIPDDLVKVAESGIASASDAAELRAAGYHAVLVGESLVMAADPAAAVRALMGET